MKKKMIVLISALILLGSISIASASVFISAGQRVYFSASSSSSYYYAMIWDYTISQKESDTAGYRNYNSYLPWSCGYGSVQVAYIYYYTTKKYVEALALRDILL